MIGRNSFATNFMWALDFVILVAIVSGAIYYTGLLGDNQRKKIDIQFRNQLVASNR